MTAWIAFAMLTLLGVAHSGLGEKLLLRPLFADDGWSTRLPRSGAQLILRFAWHLTTIAWMGLGASVVGVPAGIATGLVCLVSGLVGVLVLRRHLSWPLFLLAGFAALESASALPRLVPPILAIAGGVVALGAAGIHLYWGVGGRSGLGRAIPRDQNGEPKFRVGPLACFAVAVALGVFTFLLWLGAQGASPRWLSVLLGISVVLLMIRAVGDGREVGFTKSNRGSAFARADDTIYTPLVVVLAFGAIAALHLGFVAQ